MPTRTRTIAAVLGALALTVVSCSSSTQSSQETTPSPSTTPAAAPTPEPQDVPVAVTPVLASVVAAPVPVLATDGKIHLAYELQLTNVMTQDVTITSVKVLARDQTLFTLAGDQVGDWTRVVGTQTPSTKLGPGQSGMVWLDVALDKSAPIPADLIHTIGIAIPKPSPPLIPATMDEKVAPVTVSTHKPPVIAPPLDGPNWLDADSCCALGAHRGAVNALSGGLWAAERFAIDYVQLSPDGTIFTGEKSKPESYPYFGADIHAVADGPVVSVLDGLPEQVAGKNPTGLPLEQYGGNHIVQDIGDGNYAFYAHLKTGSVKVKEGDQLTSGAGHRLARQHRQLRCSASAFPRDEHPGSVAVQRTPVRDLILPPRFPSRVAGRRRRAPPGQARADAARVLGARRNRRQPTVARRDDI